MTQIAVLTPDPADLTYSDQWPLVLDRLGAALAPAGVTLAPQPWTDHVEDASGLAGYPLVLPVVAWGYHRDHDRWMRACRTWAEAGTSIANPATALGWNSDKTYLRRLADQGVPIPRTVWVDRATPVEVEAAFAEIGAATDVETLIVKPRVSGGAWRTLKIARGQPLVEPPAGAAMIQPFLSTIQTEGETSLLFFGGRFSHAVNKRPVNGDFRIQVQFGGQYRTVTPPDGAMTLAERVLAAIDEPLLYARIDMAPDLDGNWLLMEAELIEPDFYLAHDPAGGAGFARAVKDRLNA